MEIIPGIHSIPNACPSRIYLIEDEDLTLIDTGMPWSARQIFKYIQSIGRHPTELGRVLITHKHPDHTSGAPGIIRCSNARIMAHRADANRNRQDTAALSYMGIFGSFDLPLPFLKSTSVNCLLEESETIPVAGGINVLHTPGHTRGSVCYLLEREGLLFSGDTIFSEYGRVSRSMPFPGSDTAQYRQSLERLAEMDFDILCGGHGSPLLGNASIKFRELMERKPELPTWREFFFKRLPRRALNHMGISAEDY